MSLERIFKALIELGLSQTDARVYIYLATKGSKKANQICDALNVKKQIIYPSLKNLRKYCSKKGINVCGKSGAAIIHSHKNFDFPDLLINAYRIDEESSFGAEDALMISLWLNTPKGFRYVPVAIAGNNPRASRGWKKIHKDSFAPAAHNYQLFKRNEIQVQTQGNILFAGWTKPILLIPEQKPLPPSAIILESSGTIKSRKLELIMHNRVKLTHHFNYNDAYVTFLHEENKYLGPATEGLLATNIYIKALLP